MEFFSPILFIEINKSDFTFTVGDENDQKNFKLIYKSVLPLQGIENYQITNFDLTFKTIKKNIYLIEEKLNLTFKESIIILNNFNCSFLNLTGFKKLNGSQLLEENITYILNSLKSNIDRTENKKNIIHIFNSKYYLDKKEIKNLPIGLFGEFYSHELSFCLIDKNIFKNLNNIFDKCNLKIKKILHKSFVEGSLISNNNKNLSTFFHINIDINNSQIFYFENNSLKSDQNFDFGSDLVIKDISKITSLKTELVKKIINSVQCTQDISKDELIEKNLFENEKYVKIKKKLLFEIAEARIEELLEKFILKNLNFLGIEKKNNLILLKIINKDHLKCFKSIYERILLKNNNLEFKFLDNLSTEDLIKNANNIVNFGWKKEAIPIVHQKKSLIAKFFDALFS